MNDLDASLPLRPVEVHVLLVLLDGDLHGYGMVKEIEARSEGRVRLEPGNLYRYIRRLVDEGWVEPADRRSPAHRRSDDPHARRRYYRITELGREALRAEAVRMRSLVRATEDRLALPAEGG